MERYTKRHEDGQVVMDCANFPEGWNTNPDGKCTALYCQNRLQGRLAAYKDTNLNPETISKIRDIILDTSRDFDCLLELDKADREGQCVVLSSPMLSMVYKPNDTDVYCPKCGQSIDDTKVITEVQTALEARQKGEE